MVDRISERSRKLGRNDRCPQCGFKVKHCRCSGKRFPWKRLRKGLAIIAAGLGVACLVLLIWRTFTPGVVVEQRPVADHIRVVHAYADAKPVDQWWLPSAPTIDSSEGLVQCLALTQNKNKRIQDIITRYATISSLTRAIAAEFAGTWVSIDMGGYSRALTSSAEPEPDNVLEVCFIPQERYAPSLYPAYFYYRRGWGALMLAGLEVPDGAFAGLLFHELGHALRHRQGATSAIAAPGTDAYITEEVEMHELETNIFDAVSRGNFSVALDAIIRRLSPASDWRMVVLGLTHNDLHQIDAAIGATDAGRTVFNQLIVQYMYALGSRFIHHRVDPAQQLSQRVALYRWIGTTL